MDLEWVDGEDYSSLYDGKIYKGIIYKLPAKFYARAYPGERMVAEVAAFSSFEEAKAWVYTVVKLGD